MFELSMIGYFTIWFTPIVFITTLIGAIKAIKDGNNYKKYAIACVISFWLIIVPMFALIIELY